MKTEQEIKTAIVFKTMRHIETVRNFLNAVIYDILRRSEEHDQSKLQSPEIEILEEFTPALKDAVFGSEEYDAILDAMNVGVTHHYCCNAHHPEHYKHGINDMNLIDLIEMLCDWKAAGLRHGGDLFKSIEVNQTKYRYSDELKTILKNTACFFNKSRVDHRADES